MFDLLKEKINVKPDRLSVIMLLGTVWWKLIRLYLCLLESTWQAPLGSCSGWQTGAWLQGLLKPVGLLLVGLIACLRLKSGTCLVSFYYELFPSALCCMLGYTSSVRFRDLFKETVSIWGYCVSTKLNFIYEHLELVVNSCQIIIIFFFCKKVLIDCSVLFLYQCAGEHIR